MPCDRSGQTLSGTQRGKYQLPGASTGRFRMMGGCQRPRNDGGGLKCLVDSDSEARRRLCRTWIRSQALLLYVAGVPDEWC